MIKFAKDRDLKALRDALLSWGREYFGDEINNLGDIASKVKNKEFAGELDKLSEVLYAKSNQDWDAMAFIKAFEKICTKKYEKTNDKEPLPKLYK